MEDDDLCLICNRLLSLDTVCMLGEKGLASFTVASQRRGDEKWRKVENMTRWPMHKECRRNYTSENSILKTIRRAKQAEEPPLPITQSGFPFNTKCFFCDSDCHEAVQTKVAIDRRRKWFKVRSLVLKRNIESIAKKRNDDWADKVLKRLHKVRCLVAEEARYHDACMVKFKKTLGPKGKAGRPVVGDLALAFNELCEYIEDNDECQYLLNDLLDNMEGYVPSSKYLKIKLKEKYGDDVELTTQKNKSYVNFRDSGYKILDDNWYTEKRTNIEEERLRIVRTAAAIIREDIRASVYDISSYPPAHDFKTDVTAIPETLNTFLSDVILRNRRNNIQKLKCCSSAIAHAIISATRPRSFLSSIKMGIGIFLHKNLGSKIVIDFLSKLGLSVSYDEVLALESAGTMTYKRINLKMQHWLDNDEDEEDESFSDSEYLDYEMVKNEPGCSHTIP